MYYRSALVSVVFSTLFAAGPVLAAAPCLTALDADQPLCNAALADSPWPISHAGPYAQGSVPFAGPDLGQTIAADHLGLQGPPITLAMSPEYADGGTAVWGTILGLLGTVFKIDHDTFEIIDSFVVRDEDPNAPPLPLGVGGAYNVVDDDFSFILGRATWVEIYRDAVAGDRFSDVEFVRREFLPAESFCRASDLLVGGTMLSDGTLAFVSEQAVVSVVPGDPNQILAANVVSLPSENGADCNNPLVLDEDLEIVSNSIAADENGGFFVVTSEAMYKYHWDGAAITKLWSAEYDSDPPFSLLRLGPGSGATPSLMGTDIDEDRFVVITDGQELMHLVLMWRDEIPAGWQPIAPGKDPRIACEVPINFGDASATRSLSEQSVLVRGNAAVVVSNLLSDESNAVSAIPALGAAFAALEGGNVDVTPKGIQRVDWDPETQTCKTVWTNPDIGLPNSIPTMSAATGLMYATGLRDGVWGLEGINFASGESELFVPASQQPCMQSDFDILNSGPLGLFFIPFVERLPNSCENSLFAATEVGPDGSIYQGTFIGVTKYSPDAVTQVPARRQATAGVLQGIDMAKRGDTEAVERGEAQMNAALVELATADLDTNSAAMATVFATAGRDHLSNSEPNEALEDLEEALDWLTPCPPEPQDSCLAASRSGSLNVQQPLSGKNRLVWNWKGDKDAFTLAETPDPTDDADYALCVYNGTSGARLAEMRVPANPTDWRAQPRGFRYFDRSLTNNGIRRILIRPSRGTIKVDGKGIALPPLTLPIAVPFTVQLTNSESGRCWETDFDAGDVRKNDGTALKVRAR